MGQKRTEEVLINLEPDRHGRHGGAHVLVIERNIGADDVGTTAVTHIRRRLPGPEHVIIGGTHDDMLETDEVAYVKPMRRGNPDRKARRQRHRRQFYLKR